MSASEFLAVLGVIGLSVAIVGVLYVLAGVVDKVLGK